MTKQYQMCMLVMNYLEKLDTDWDLVGEAISDENLEASYKLIQENPNISREEFLERMQISED